MTLSKKSLITEPSKSLEVTKIRDDHGNLISFMVSGGTNIQTLLDRFDDKKCLHDTIFRETIPRGSKWYCRTCFSEVKVCKKELHALTESEQMHEDCILCGVINP